MINIRYKKAYFKQGDAFARCQPLLGLLLR